MEHLKGDVRLHRGDRWGRGGRFCIPPLQEPDFRLRCLCLVAELGPYGNESIDVVEVDPPRILIPVLTSTMSWASGSVCLSLLGPFKTSHPELKLEEFEHSLPVHTLKRVTPAHSPTTLLCFERELQGQSR